MTAKIACSSGMMIERVRGDEKRLNVDRP